MHTALGFSWRNLTNSAVFDEKLVILFTDGAPNGLFNETIGDDPWVLSNKFCHANIILMIIGVGENTVECDDFYCALAENTGGRYIPMINFEKIFARVLYLVFNDGDTIHQALKHIPSEEYEQNSKFEHDKIMDSRVNGMINECKSMGDIRRKFFKRPIYK